MGELTRRGFLSCSAAAMVLAMAPPCPAFWGQTKAPSGPKNIRGQIFKADAPQTLWKWSHEGFRYTKLEDGRVTCGICPHRCTLAPGDRGVCRSRVNMSGTLYSLAYGNPCAVHVDPIEKKPLYHFRPTSKAFSIAAAGCNLRCLNCQNWQISQTRPRDVRHQELFPKQVVAAARETGSASIAYTYTEPVTFFEYTLHTARQARKAGLTNVWISAGYINRKPLQVLCEVLDGANVNLKAFDDDIYRKLNGARLNPVLDTFRTLHEQGVHFEMTHLVVPGYVDDPEIVKRMCDWILENVGPDHPLHFTRFYPRYKLDRLAPTPVSTLTRFRELAMAAGIHYAYVGNVPGHEGNHTYCHACGRLLIERQGYLIPAMHLNYNRCRYCNTPIPGVWNRPETPIT